MSDINFLDNKKPGDNQKPKDKDSKKEKLAWSSPKKDDDSSKSAFFSFLPFANKKEPAGTPPVSIIDKNKIKQSREEILNLIKHHENSKPQPEEKKKNFFSVLAEKLKKQSAPKEVLIDYQQAFKREKERKDQIGKIFNIKQASEDKPMPLLAEKPEDSWLDKWIESLRKKIIASSARKDETAKMVKLSKAQEAKPAAVKRPATIQPIIQTENKQAESKEINVKEKEKILKNESRMRVLETNLIQGELVNFFDWHSKIIILVNAILIPIFVIGAVYYGLAFYQKSNQVKNLAQAEKFKELEQAIAEEESGVKKILDFQNQLKLVSQIFEQHLYWTNFFNFLEDNTIKDVYFTNFDGDTSGNYTMEALAVNYNNIPEQVNVFRNNRKVTAVKINGGEMVAGDNKNKSLVKFIMDFSILKSIFTE